MNLLHEKPWMMAVKAVIIDAEGRHLLLRRSASSRNFVGAWEWPGGKLDPGEDYATGVLRETREEIGLEIAITGLAGATSFEMEKANVVLLCMEARITGGELHLSGEHDAYEWVPQDELGSKELTGSVGAFMIEYAQRKVNHP